MSTDETGLVFVIDGNDYPSPLLETLDMAERRVLYDLSGIVQEDFVRDEDEETEDEHTERVRKLTRHPGFMEALMHIAYARGNPGLKRDKVQAVIDRTNFMEAVEKWADTEAEEGDALPPVRTSEPDATSPSSSLERPPSSGSGSTNGSDEPVKTPESIGTSKSPTSPTSAPTTLDV